MHALCQKARLTHRLGRRRTDARANDVSGAWPGSEGARGAALSSPLGRLRPSQHAIPETTHPHAGDDVLGTSSHLDLRLRHTDRPHPRRNHLRVHAQLLREQALSG